MHPSNQLPRNQVILDGTNAFDAETSYAIYNPTANAVSMTVTGSFWTYSGTASAYVEDGTAQTVAVPSGSTVFGRFSSVNGTAGVICYF